MPVVAGRSKIILQTDGFIVVDGVKIGRLVGGHLELKDKDRRRADARGSAYIYVPIAELAIALRAMCDET